MQARQTTAGHRVPTRCVLLRLEPGDEVSVDIERGKTLIVRFVAVSDGLRTVRERCSSSSTAAALGEGAGSQSRCAQAAARKADPTNQNHVGARCGHVYVAVRWWRESRAAMCCDDRSDEDGTTVRRPRRTSPKS
jgi:pyruvate carboxylase